ncbi:MAG: helix-turn-helix transcriptional regulator [Hungatella hathewayi]|nr:helix-turn-helix transcriptional regulator [Hungatella hathewayi]
MDIQGRIRQLMEERGWSEYRLSKQSHLSQSTVSNIFRKSNAPALPTLKSICNGFGITLAQFFSEDSESIELTEQQKELFKKWSTLNETQKKILLDLMNNMYSEDTQ